MIQFPIGIEPRVSLSLQTLQTLAPQVETLIGKQDGEGLTRLLAGVGISERQAPDAVRELTLAHSLSCTLRIEHDQVEWMALRLQGAWPEVKPPMIEKIAACMKLEKVRMRST